MAGNKFFSLFSNYAREEKVVSMSVQNSLFKRILLGEKMPFDYKIICRLTKSPEEIIF